MTSIEKELLDCLKDYIKQTETAMVQEGIWFNKVYKDARNLVKKLTIPVVVGQSEQLSRCKCGEVVKVECSECLDTRLISSLES